MKGAIITETKYLRFLSEKQAAEYTGYTITSFRRICPVEADQRPNGVLKWDVVKLDKWLDNELAVETKQAIDDAINAL